MSLIGYGIDIEEAERGVLAELMFHPENLGQVSSWLEEDDFHRPIHQATYRAIKSTAAEGSEVSPMSVAQTLWRQAGGYAEWKAMNSTRPKWAEGKAGDLWQRQQRVRLEQYRASLISEATNALADVLTASEPGNVAVYGRRVLEGSVQRRMAVYGEAVVDIGRRHDPLSQPEDILRQATERLDQLQTELEKVRDRIALSQETLDRMPPRDVVPFPGDPGFNPEHNAGVPVRELERDLAY